MLNLACCGNVCNECPRYIATKSNDNRKLDAVAILWKNCGWRDEIVSAQEIMCYGCKSIKNCKYELRDCALNKGIENCGLCDKYPCSKINEAFERTSKYSDFTSMVCDNITFDQLRKAFYYKKQNLDNTHERINT